MKPIRRIYPYGPAVGEYTSNGTVAETFARVRVHQVQNLLLLRERALKLNRLLMLCDRLRVDPSEQPEVVRTRRELASHYDCIMDVLMR